MSEQSVPTVPSGEGNTSSLHSEERYVEHPSVGWCFTVFNYTEEKIKELCAICAENPKVQCYIFGREICPETGRPHLQSYVGFKPKVKTRWRTLFKDVLPDSTNRRPAKGSEYSNLKYCAKDGNFVSNKKILPVFKKPARVLLPWQVFTEKRIIHNTQNDRKVLWIYDTVGNIGKSVMVDYLVNEYNGMAISGAKRHVLAVAHKNKNCPLWIFDIPRTNKNGISYDALEALRNGLWMSGFGDCTGMTRLDFNPSIVVFCNELPEWDKLSHDRWDVWEMVNINGAITPTYRDVGYKVPLQINYCFDSDAEEYED